MSGWRAVVKVLRSPASLSRTLLDDLTTTLLPAACRCCEGPLERASLVPVCEMCVGRISVSRITGCSLCGEAIDLSVHLEDLRFAASLTNGLLCRECRLAAPDFARAVAYGTYDDELRELIHLLKFERVPAAASLLGRRLAEAILRLEGHTAEDLTVVAVPLFPHRERQRGYNQSVLLASAALRELRRLRPAWRLTPAHTALERTRSTESSFVLSRSGRRRNLAGAFRVTQDLRGREILLVDDIYTSGATARECARVLMRAGAARVWVVTLARAQKRFLRRQHEDPGEYVAAWDLPSARPA